MNNKVMKKGKKKKKRKRGEKEGKERKKERKREDKRSRINTFATESSPFVHILYTSTWSMEVRACSSAYCTNDNIWIICRKDELLF